MLLHQKRQSAGRGAGSRPWVQARLIVGNALGNQVNQGKHRVRTVSAKALKTLIYKGQQLGVVRQITNGGRQPQGGVDCAPRGQHVRYCLLYTSPSPRDGLLSRMP